MIFLLGALVEILYVNIVDADVPLLLRLDDMDKLGVTIDNTINTLIL